MKSSMVMALWLVLAGSILSGCGKSKNPNGPSESVLSSNTQGEATVELTTNQVKAVKIEEVGTYAFPVEKETVGSVNFEEDLGIVQAKTALVSAAATLDLANKTLARLRGLGQTNGIAEKDLEQAVSTQVAAEAAVRAAREAVRALGISDEEINQMVVTGKIAGGTPALPGDSHGQDAGATSKWVTANVIESDIPLFHVGQTVEARVTAYSDRVFGGKISRIYGTVDPNTHRMEMRCEVDDSKDELRPGMLANLLIRVREPVEATAIQAMGVVREDDGTMTAWVTTDRHRFMQRKLKVGLQKDGRYQVLDGLRAGELAVTEGAIFLSNLLNAPPSD